LPSVTPSYSGKVGAYVGGRWDYAPEAIAAICAIVQVHAESCVADIGAGTGMLGRHFLDRVGRVIAVEPDPEMRRGQPDAPNFESRSGWAQDTGLADHSVDVIVVGRALHWFDPVPSRTEFARILRPGGWLAVLQTPTLDTALTADLAGLCRVDLGWDVSRSKQKRLAQNERSVSPRFYFYEQPPIELLVPDVVRETWEQFFDRLCSFSGAPGPDHPRFSAFWAAALDVFNRRAQGGLLHIARATKVELKQIA